jgi:hypothetical protein
LEGYLIKEYSSIVDAEKELKIQTIKKFYIINKKQPVGLFGNI